MFEFKKLVSTGAGHPQVHLCSALVPLVPQVSYNTTWNQVQCVPVPTTGVVFAGMGVDLDLLTCGIPVLNPTFMIE